MKIGDCLALTGLTVLLGACSGVTELGHGPGAAGSGGNAQAEAGGAGTPAAGMAGDEASKGGEAGELESPPAGGAGGSAGSGGMGGVPSQALAAIDSQQRSDKLDVLFVIDNSVSMTDKQTLLAKSLPPFIARLVNPPCVDAQGKPVATQPDDGSAACSSGTRQFAPVVDMHLAAISTSLGAHGGTVCAQAAAGDTLDDQAQLLPSKRKGVPNYKGSGFLSYDVTGKAGIADSSTLTTQLGAMVSSAGQHGCGFEATLESMYRFLIDPEPPVSIELGKTSYISTPTGVNQDLLKQRAAFLRPDSSVAIVILSDENDCSIVDTGVGWFVGSSARMPHATESCAANPNDACCRSCAMKEKAPPTGCKPLSEDAFCSKADGNAFATWDMLHDSLNLRCFAQQARFGFDLLNPLDRYSVGLTNPKVYDWHDQLVDNPLFAARSGKGPRSNSLISLSVIVGAAWQDLATDDSRTSANLTYLGAADLESKQRWPLLVGDPSKNVKPTDPLMIESVEERSGTSPLTKAPIAPASSQNPLENPGNGHEQNIPDRADLQYACTFALPEPVQCPAASALCDCSPDRTDNPAAVVAANSPLCQPPTGGPASTTQYFAKGYPGTRELLLAQTLAGRAAPASICPKDTSTESSANYGYVPALNALVDRLAVTLK